jgi:hypothetical protein
MGTIQLRAAGTIEGTPFWRRQRQLHLQNNHHEAGSVYLVNALMPDDSAITVVAQTRDATQRDARIHYNVAPRWAAYAYWPIVGSWLVGGWWFLRRERHNSARHAPCTRSAGA